MIKFILSLLTLLPVFISGGCGRIPEDVREALALAGGNRNNLEQVIRHYTQTGEEQKRQAACFLIANMPERYSIDTGQSGNLRYDLYTITTDQLIQIIDAKYAAWKRNRFSSVLPFKTFCEHILPYRPQDGIAVDYYFLERQADHFRSLEKGGASLQDAVDSLLVCYDTIRYSVENTGVKPVLGVEDVLAQREIECHHRVWFNYYLLSSVGIPVAIDFVPNWGNRNASHTWNTIVMDTVIYPFEPFYSADRWEYKNIYDNKAEDGFVLWWGKFRLPKVYRLTFHRENIQKPGGLEQEADDLPSLFRSPYIRDVSAQYFETSDVELPVDLPGDRQESLYLCVENRLNWVPVQRGIQHAGRVVFKQMGRDIVYLPAFYRNGCVVPAGEPFYLTPGGTVRYLTADSDGRENTTLHLTRRYPLNKKKADSGLFEKDRFYVQPGEEYELFYWQDEWISLGRKQAVRDVVTFENVPAGRFYYLDCSVRDAFKRIFIYRDGEQLFY